MAVQTKYSSTDKTETTGATRTTYIGQQRCFGQAEQVMHHMQVSLDVCRRELEALIHFVQLVRRHLVLVYIYVGEFALFLGFEYGNTTALS